MPEMSVIAELLHFFGGPDGGYLRLKKEFKASVSAASVKK